MMNILRMLVMRAGACRRVAVFLSLLTLARCSSTGKGADPSAWTDAQVEEWFDGRDWSALTSMQPHPSIDKRKLAVQYHLHPALWDSAFAFMRRNDFARLAPGNYPLAGDDVFVKASEYGTKMPSEAFYEVHKNYADIHFVVSGEESIGKGDVSAAKARTPYDTAKDIQFYEGVEGSEMLARPGTFYIFFPGEGHRPGVAPGESARVRKIVVKVRC